MATLRSSSACVLVFLLASLVSLPGAQAQAANCTGNPATNGTDAQGFNCAQPTADGANCTAACLTGYTGSVSSLCNNGTWEAPSGGCTIITCSGSPANQTWATGFACSNNTYQATCQASCLAGYTGSNFTATCSAAGNWTVSGAACQPINCTASPANQSFALGFACANKTFGSSCSASCIAGYAGGVTATCASTGSWQYTGSCQPQNCSATPPSNLTNGAWNCAATSNSTCTATCNSGFIGGGSATCLLGNWTQISGNCTPAPCASAPSAPNANFPSSCLGLAHNRTCNGTCQSGFAGSATATCSFGSWQVINTCAPLPCTNVPAQTLPNVAPWPAICNGTLSGGICEGSCANNSFRGSPKLTCYAGNFTANGSCTPNPPDPCPGLPPSIPNANPFPASCNWTATLRNCSTTCKNGFFASPSGLYSICLNTVWQVPVGNCSEMPVSRCTTLPPTSIANQAPWPSACASPGTDSGGSCLAPCANSSGFTGTGASSQCINGEWLPASGSCQPAGSNVTIDASVNYALIIDQTSDLNDVLNGYACATFNALLMTSPDTCANVRVTVTGIVPANSSGGKHRRSLHQTAGSILLKLLVEVINAKSVPASEVRLRLDSPATTTAIAQGLAAALAAAGRDIAAGDPRVGSVARTDAAGTPLETPKPITVDCAAMGLVALAPGQTFTLGSTLLSPFRLSAPFVTGAIQLTAALDGLTPCTTNPVLLSGSQPGVDITVDCGNNVWQGPHAVTLQAAYTGSNGCPSGTMLQQITVYVMAQVAPPVLSLSANPTAPTCKGTAGPAVVATFAYQVEAVVGFGPLAFAVPEVTTSSDAATCTAVRAGYLQGTVTVTCRGAFPASLTAVDISVTLKAQQPGTPTAVASASSSVTLLCCTAGTVTAHALPSFPRSCNYCGSSAALAGVYQQFDREGMFAGDMATAVTTSCESSANVGSVAVVCDSSRRLSFQVTNPAGSSSEFQFLVACNQPVRGTACAGSGWKTVGLNSNSFGAKTVVVDDKAVTTWVYLLTGNANSCNCGSAWFAVKQTGRFSQTSCLSSAASRKPGKPGKKKKKKTASGRHLLAGRQ